MSSCDARIGGVRLGVYVHIPFCKVRCSYCDFNTYAGLEALMPAYVQALCGEILLVSRAAEQAGLGRPVATTVFFGGGTPSLLPPHHLASILGELRRAFALTEGCEISLEANPGTVDAGYLRALRDLGVNRLSFGVQSAQPDELRLLDRLHTFEQAVEAVDWARQAGFDNLNLDLIYGIMGQTLADWQDTLHRAVDLAPEHLSLYALTLEAGTPMQTQVEAGVLAPPDPDVAADMYEWSRGELERAGYQHYEISNWGRGEPGDHRLVPAYACRHNLLTWHLQPYLGLGAGAHGSVPGWRYANVRHPTAYVERIRTGQPAAFPFSPAVAETWPIDPETERRERLLVGLRLVEEGVESREFAERFGLSLEGSFGAVLHELEAQGLLEVTAERVRLTKRGHLLGNRVFIHFV
jgi:oxygen-independent coproporphyrinogen III oxidase